MGKNVRAVKKREEREQSATVQEAVSAYLNSPHVKDLLSSTRKEYSEELQVFADWCSSHMVIQDRKTKAWKAVNGDEQVLLAQVNDQVVSLFVEHLKATHKPNKKSVTELSTYTLAGYVRVIKAFLNWCSADNDYSNQVQFATVARIELPQVIETIVQPFTDEQLKALFDACEKEESEHLQIRDRAILAVLLDTGIRAHELVTLEIGNVSLDAKDAYIRVLGKGQKWGEVGLGEQSRRILQKYIRMFREPTIEHALRDQQLSPRQMKQAIDREPVFMNRYGKPLTVFGLGQMVERLGEWAHVEGVRCTPHTFRHSFAVRFWRRTKDIRTLSKLLRHSSIAVTEKYLRSILQSEARRGAPSILDELNHL